MKRSLVAITLAAVLAVPTVPAPSSTADMSSCLAPDRLQVAQAGCCQRQGGVCGCRGGTPKCCNGTMGGGCSCRQDSPTAEHES
jgi:hypothetical protein